MKNLLLIISLVVVIGLANGCKTAYQPIKKRSLFSENFYGEEVLFFSDSIKYTIRCPIGECRINYFGPYEGKRITMLAREVEQDEGPFISSFEETIKLKIRVKDSVLVLINGRPFSPIN